MLNRVTAVFDSKEQAGQAIIALRQIGVTDAQLSVLGGSSHATPHADHDDAGERAGKGALAGASVGALFGLAALAIPGVGPFITAGFLAEALGVAGGAAVAGAIVGGTSGAVAGAMSRAGYDEHEANFYGSAVERGGVVVAVNTHGMASDEQVRSILLQHGGRSAGASI